MNKELKYALIAALVFLAWKAKKHGSARSPGNRNGTIQPGPTDPYQWLSGGNGA